MNRNIATCELNPFCMKPVQSVTFFFMTVGVCVCVFVRVCVCVSLCLVCLEGKKLYERTGNILMVLLYFEGSCS